MQAEIVIIGTEILLGEIVDTNAALLARMLREIGIDLYYKTTVGDNEDRITDVLDQALDRREHPVATLQMPAPAPPSAGPAPPWCATCAPSRTAAAGASCGPLALLARQRLGANWTRSNSAKHEHAEPRS